MFQCIPQPAFLKADNLLFVGPYCIQIGNWIYRIIKYCKLAVKHFVKGMNFKTCKVIISSRETSSTPGGLIVNRTVHCTNKSQRSNFTCSVLTSKWEKLIAARDILVLGNWSQCPLSGDKGFESGFLLPNSITQEVYLQLLRNGTWGRRAMPVQNQILTWIIVCLWEQIGCCNTWISAVTTIKNTSFCIKHFEISWDCEGQSIFPISAVELKGTKCQKGFFFNWQEKFFYQPF